MFAGQNLIFRHYYIQNDKDRIQIRVYKINNENVTHFSQLISVTIKKILRKLGLILGKVKKIEAHVK